VIRFVCRCGKKLASSEEFCQEEVKCTSCGRILIVPEKDLDVAEEVRFSSAALISFLLSLVPFSLVLLFAIAYLFGFSEHLIGSGSGDVVPIAARIFHAVSFCSVVFVQPLAIIFGAIALSRIRKREGLLCGERLASAAIIIAACWLALVGSMLIVALVRF
jgi:hypothetical protein